MRLKRLDVLRGVAILLVLGRHEYGTLLWMRVGWVGVDLFFVLSGFLVSGLLFTEYKKYRQIDLPHFLIRRGWKIYPPYYYMLLLTALIAGRDHFLSLRHLLAEGVFIQNYYQGYWEHTWSLAVEEHFYLLLVTGIFLVARARRDSADPFVALPKVFVVIAIVLLAARILTAIHQPFSLLTHLYPTHLRLDSLLFGVLISYYYHFRSQIFVRVAKHRALLAAAACIFIAPCLWLDVENVFIHTVCLSCLYLGFGAVLILCLAPEGDAAWQVGGVVGVFGDLLSWIGKSSYSIYLWHSPVGAPAMAIGAYLFNGKYHGISFAFYVSASVMLGAGMAKLIEVPALKIRARYWPTRSGSIAPRSTPAKVSVAAASASARLEVSPPPASA